VVLKAGQHAPAVQIELDRDVADQARPLLADGADVEQPHALDLLAVEAVGAPEQLIAAADAEHDRVARRRALERVALGGEQVLGAQALVAVLAAAEVEEVVGVGIERLAEPARLHAEADPAPLTT